MRKNIRLAVFIGYTGDELNGMQWQREGHVKTVQNELISKWFQQGFLKTERFVELVKNFKWSRAARTDKGVHALLNGVSCVFTVKDQYWEESQNGQKKKQELEKQVEINNPDQVTNQAVQEIDPKKIKLVLKKDMVLSQFKAMFDSIVVYSIKQVDNKFDMRHAVKNRTYCYMCPMFMFQNQQKNVFHEQTLAKINRLCQSFIGTHNYHNYSSGIKAKDPSAKRYILSMSCKITDVSELTKDWPQTPIWLKFSIHGQSFIYHQIRKMIGVIIQVFLFSEPEGFIENTFFNNILRILLAPPEGLYLQSLRFDGYNKGNVPEKLVFSQNQQQIQQMRVKIQKKIIESEKTYQKFIEWLGKIKKGEQIKDQDIPKDMQIQQ